MKIKVKNKDATPSESLVPLTKEEADKRLKNLIDKNGGANILVLKNYSIIDEGVCFW